MAYPKPAKTAKEQKRRERSSARGLLLLKRPEPKTLPPPHVTITANFVSYGYQIDYYAKGEHLGFECRDFSGNYKLADLAEGFIFHMQKAVEEFRKTK